jgi:hypothetical protein
MEQMNEVLEKEVFLFCFVFKENRPESQSQMNRRAFVSLHLINQEIDR